MWKRGAKRREMGLGSFLAVSLAKAREKAAACRAILGDGGDPITARDQNRTVPTFAEAAHELIGVMAPAWRSPKHRAQWVMTLGDAYCARLRLKPVNAVDTEDVLAVLKPIWQSRPETASRLRGRIEAVLSWAKAHGYRGGENPAAWRGHLDKLLPKRRALARGHHSALSYSELPTFVARLRERKGTGALALEFAILTAGRSGEVLGARWNEFDLDAKVWVVPGSRMKAGREHRVPLSDRAVDIIDQMRCGKTCEFVFPSGRRGAPLSAMAMGMLLRRMGVDATVHGFRSAFRDWAGNETHIAREIAEAALAHSIGDKAEQAYRRSDALEKRRALMALWSSFCGTSTASDNVLRFAQRESA